MIKILSLPARHPYTSKFHNSGHISFCNPETDYFNKIGGGPTPEFIGKIHSSKSYDLVHIHFSFDKIELNEFKRLLEYFKNIGKHIIWTCHSKESQRKRNIGNGKFQEMLYEYSTALISPTIGCKEWLASKFGNKKDVEVIPLGYMINPDLITLNIERFATKKKTNFIYLIGDMRENKEIIYSLKTFINSPEFKDCILTIISKPLSQDLNTLDERRRAFMEISTSSSRIKLISKQEVTNEELVDLFSNQHVCLLPYLWGTHSGQIELGKDCGCYSVVSDVGFYGEQSETIVEFTYDDNLSIFANNFREALVKAKNLPILSPEPGKRKEEMEQITEKHIILYKRVLGNQ